MKEEIKKEILKLKKKKEIPEIIILTPEELAELREDLNLPYDIDLLEFENINLFIFDEQAS